MWWKEAATLLSVSSAARSVYLVSFGFVCRFSVLWFRCFETLLVTCTTCLWDSSRRSGFPPLHKSKDILRYRRTNQKTNVCSWSTSFSYTSYKYKSGRRRLSSALTQLLWNPGRAERSVFQHTCVRRVNIYSDRYEVLVRSYLHWCCRGDPTACQSKNNSKVITTNPREGEDDELITAGERQGPTPGPRRLRYKYLFMELIYSELNTACTLFKTFKDKLILFL